MFPFLFQAHFIFKWIRNSWLIIQTIKWVCFQLFWNLSNFIFYRSNSKSVKKKAYRNENGWPIDCIVKKGFNSFKVRSVTVYYTIIMHGSLKFAKPFDNWFLLPEHKPAMNVEIFCTHTQNLLELNVEWKVLFPPDPPVMVPQLWVLCA